VNFKLNISRFDSIAVDAHNGRATPDNHFREGIADYEAGLYELR